MLPKESQHQTWLDGSSDKVQDGIEGIPIVELALHAPGHAPPRLQHRRGVSHILKVGRCKVGTTARMNGFLDLPDFLSHLCLNIPMPSKFQKNPAHTSRTCFMTSE